MVDAYGYNHHWYNWIKEFTPDARLIYTRIVIDGRIEKVEKPKQKENENKKHSGDNFRKFIPITAKVISGIDNL